MRMFFSVTLSFVVGAAIALVIYTQFNEQESNTDMGHSSDSTHRQSKKTPLYWVAPMDANFRRDKPGKSPMGMDLIPFYAAGDDGNSNLQNEQAGRVKVSPNVVNNLGVRTDFARNAPLENTIQTVGYVGYNEDKIVHMHPRVEGWVDALYVSTAGESVTKGQKVYGIYSPQLVSAQEEYLLAKKRNNPALIKAARLRLQSLHMPKEALVQLDSSNAVMQSVTFYAPQSGVLEHLKIRHGFYVEPGTTLMSIASLDEVWVEAEVFEQQVDLLEEGLGVTMSVGYLPGRLWQGKLDYIYPSLDQTTRALRVRLRFENPDRLLKPNMFANVTIKANTSLPALLVPRSAVIRTGVQDRVVLALGDGYFKSIEVKLGRMNREFIEILSGIQAGDEVVVSAQFLLDSQSSISSDFKRYEHHGAPNMQGMTDTQDMPDMNTHSSANKPNIQRASVRGVINSVDVTTRRVNISRGGIKKWNRGPATMDFVLGSELEQAQIDRLQETKAIQFTFEIRDGDFVITKLSVVDEETP